MKLVKKGIKQSIRWTLMLITILFIGASSFALYEAKKKSNTIDETPPSHNYQINSEVKYIVGLKSNPIYDTEVLGESALYISNFVDTIEAEFNYEFNGEKNSRTAGEYEVIAIMEANTSEDDNSTVVWKKEFTLIPRGKFMTESACARIEKKLSIKYEEYNNMKTTITQSYKFQTPVKITVFLNVYLNNITENGVVTKKTTSSLSFPLNNDYFEIKKTEVHEKSEELNVTEQIRIGIPENLDAFFISIIVLLSAFLMYIIFFTIGITTTSRERTLNKIFKNHGKRLAALSSGKPDNIEVCLSVTDIEDLVRIADELGKPIFYTDMIDHLNTTEFYVIEDRRLYLYELRTKS